MPVPDQYSSPEYDERTHVKLQHETFTKPSRYKFAFVLFGLNGTKTDPVPFLLSFPLHVSMAAIFGGRKGGWLCMG